MKVGRADSLVWTGRCLGPECSWQIRSNAHSRRGPPILYVNSYKASMAVCLIESNKQYFFRCESSIHLCFVGMNGRPLGRASCQSPKPKGGAEGAEIDSERVCQATIGSP
jgi:hypothetical protein